MDNTNHEFITNLNIKENVYLLGLLWADGYISRKYNGISICLLENDFRDISNLLTKNINNKPFIKSPKNSKNTHAGIHFSSERIHDFLVKYDYLIKSGASPINLLKIIPENLRHYWFRGFFDGDGSIYFSTRRQLGFWSTINQNWDFMIDLLKYLNIEKYSIIQYKRKNSTHLSSCFEIRIINDIRKIMEYIYKDYDNIGLSRKYQKYLLFLQNIKNAKIAKTSTNKYICFNNRNKKWKANFD